MSAGIEANARVEPTVDVEAVLGAYVECALWSSTDEADEPLDANYGCAAFAPETLGAMRADVEAFVAGADERALALWAADFGEEQIGHDFWLTRNGHGAGFWDRYRGGLGAECGRILTAEAKPYGSCDLYV